MSRTAAGRALSIATLLLLTIAVASVFDATSTAGDGATKGSAAVEGAMRDGVHAVAAVPARASDWVNGQQRGLQGNDQLVAVLLTAAVLLLAQARRRAALVTGRGCAPRGGQRSGSRAPPAFA
jgi:hypothetical protein